MTWQTLQMAREAWDIGRPLESWRLMDECQPDFEYVRRTAQRRVPRFMLDTGPEQYDYENWEPLPVADQMRAHVAEVRAIDWAAWHRPWPITSVTVGDFTAAMRRMYPPEALTMMALQPSPFLSALQRNRDEIEVRIRSYANLIQPIWYSRIHMDDEGV